MLIIDHMRSECWKCQCDMVSWWHIWHLLDQWQSYRKWFTHTVMISISGINWASYTLLLGLQLQNIINHNSSWQLTYLSSIPFLQNSHKIDMNIIIDFVVSCLIWLIHFTRDVVLKHLTWALRQSLVSWQSILKS